MAGISITLGGNFSKLDELKGKVKTTAKDINGSISGIKDKTKAFKKEYGDLLDVAGKGIGMGAAAAAAGIAAAVALVAASMKSAIDAGGELNDMMLRTGASGKGLLIMGRAFKNAGLSADDVGSALNRMQKALAGVNEEGEPTNEAFKKLGLSVAELAGMDPVAAFRKISDAISSLANPAQRTAVAMEIFGKSGGKMLAVVTDASAFAGAAEQLGTLADVLPEIAADADFVGDAVGGLDDKTKQFGAGVVKELMPALVDMAKAINTADFVSLGQSIGAATKDAAGFALALADVVGFASYIPRKVFLPAVTYIPRKIIEGAASLNPTEGIALPLSAVSIDSDGKAILDPQATAHATMVVPPIKPADKKTAKANYTKGPDNSLATAMEKARQQAKETAEKEKQKAIAADEYKLEAAIIQARLTGNNDDLAKLNREKAIREEMAKLTGAGWDSKMARVQGIKMVNARTAADSAEKSRKNPLQSNAGGLGAFAQSMNVLFGRSANAGLIEENKRQTKLLQDIATAVKVPPRPLKIEVVPTF